MNKDSKIKFTASPSDYMKAVENKSGIEIQFHVISRELEAIIIKILHRYLEEYDILYMKNPILNIIKELMNNAVKANMKRLYFNLKKLDINSPKDYEKGMLSFKEDTYNNEENTGLFNNLEESGLFVKISFQSTEKDLSMSVTNNMPILDSELKKVRERIVKAYEYNDISEAFDDVIDDSEGAGLGLIMAMMLFKNSGLPADSFTLSKKKDQTIATILIPQRMVHSEKKMLVAKKILKEIIDLPSFPENITSIQKLCASPHPSVKKIIETISLDPGLTAAILKHANSPGFIAENSEKSEKKISTIEEAVKVLGVKGINALLVASGVSRIISSKYKKYENLWKKSSRRAFYAQKLAIQLKVSAINNFAYLAGLLADIGNMVFLSIEPELIHKLKEIAGYKGIDDTNLLEEISLGLSHSALGAMICEKWKFDETLVKAVEFHHRPYMSPKIYKQIIYIVYLAEIFIEIEENKSRFETVDEDVLEYFNIINEKKFKFLHGVLKEAYRNRS